MINIPKICPLCNEELKKGTDSIHFNCEKCDISWHIEDLDGKIEKIIKIIKKPKNESSQTYLQQERNASTLLYSSNWLIWGVKNTLNKNTKKRNDILLINKHNKTEFKILNWKRCQRVKGKGIHSWHYELYLGDTLLKDGEYITDDYRRSKQSDFIGYIMNIIRNDYNELYTEIVDCGHRTDRIVHRDNQKICIDCYWNRENEEYDQKGIPSQEGKNENSL